MSLYTCQFIFHNSALVACGLFMMKGGPNRCFQNVTKHNFISNSNVSGTVISVCLK